MGKWWIGAALTMGWLGVSAVNAQEAPFPDVQGLQGAPVGPPPGPTYAVPPAPPIAPAMGPGGERGFDNAFDPPPECMPALRFHADFEYLGWWTKHTSLPILATRGSALDAAPGALGQPNTVPLISGGIDDAFHSGGRLNLGYDFCECSAWRVEASAFILQNRFSTDTVSATGDLGTAFIARPFFNFLTNQQDAAVVASPGVRAGSVAVQQSLNVYGGEANVVWNGWSHDASTLYGSYLVGPRYLELHESLAISQTTIDLAGGNNPGAVAGTVENFTTRNRFYGGQVGAEFSYVFGPFTCQLVSKLGVGQTDQLVNVNAASQTIQADGTILQTANNSVLVQPSNSGTVRKSVLAYIPEVSVNGYYTLNEHIRLGAGYDYLYWSRVLRPGDQIDQGVDNLGLQPRPAALLHESSFWMQGLNATLELSF